MIELSIEPPSVAAEVSRIVTVCLGNPDVRDCTNVVVGLNVPAEVGLEQGRSRFELARLARREVYEHALRIRPLRPGRFTIGVPNLSFRNGYGQSRRERGRYVELLVEPAAERPGLLPPVSPRNHGRPPPSVFVSYRRSDTKMLVPGLVRDLGRRRVLRHVDFFLDLKDIRVAEVWPEVLDRELWRCTLLIAVIGPTWLSAMHDDGRRRIDDPEDAVGQEIAVALQRGIPLIPLLVDARMPKAADLPPALCSLATRQGLLFDLARYDRSVAELADAVDVLLAAAPAP